MDFSFSFEVTDNPQRIPIVHVTHINPNFHVIERVKCVPWTPEEDAMLSVLVAKYARKQWGQVTQELSNVFPPGRSINQCNQRWMRVLNQDIKRGKWNQDEDEALIKALLACEPHKWRDITALMPGRTDIQVRFRVKKIGVWLLRNGVGAERLEICIE